MAPTCKTFFDVFSVCELGKESKEEFLKQFFKSFKALVAVFRLSRLEAEESSIRDALALVDGEVHEHLDALLLRVQELEVGQK